MKNHFKKKSTIEKCYSDKATRVRAVLIVNLLLHEFSKTSRGPLTEQYYNFSPFLLCLTTSIYMLVRQPFV